jgi:predicted transcriptional regulator
MPFVTFIYRIDYYEKIFYGKYIWDEIENIDEELDNLIKPLIIKGINDYRKQKGLEKVVKKISLGILSFSSDRFAYLSSDKEIECFDFYYNICKDESESKIYINGELII